MAAASNISPTTDDNRIHDDVCRQFTWQCDIQSQEINVEVKKSVVLLSGYVETCLDKLEAEKAAKAVCGVTSVINNIQVEPKQPKTDSEVANDVIGSLQRIACVLDELPTVSVLDGVAVLRGQVRWEFQRASAEKAADAVIGVRQVVNLIEVVRFDRLTSCRQANRRWMDSTPSSEIRIESRPVRTTTT